MSAIPMNWRGRRILVEASDDVRVVEVRTAEKGESEDDDSLPESLAPVADREAVKKLASVDFDEVVDLVTTCSNALFDGMERLVKPDEASIEFGVKIAGELGLPVLTKLSSEGSIKVTVTWKRTPPPGAPRSDGHS